MHLAAAVDQLYGAAPEKFVPARKRLAAQARQDGDRMLATRVLALRKPTLPAWAINVAVRDNAAALGALIEFAEAMREAQTSLDGQTMRELSRERECVLLDLEAAVVACAREHGQRLTPAVLAEVRGTFIAAIADPAAQEAVLSGCLTRALNYAGLGEVDLTQATAAPARQRAADRGDADAPAGPEAVEPEAVKSEAAEPEAVTSEAVTSNAVTSKAAEPDAPAADAPAERERAAARRRLLDRARDRLTEAEREVTARSLARAKAHEEAQRATARAGELERLLRRATAEADTAREAQQAADQALEEATASRDDARAELAALDD